MVTSRGFTHPRTAFGSQVFEEPLPFLFLDEVRLAVPLSLISAGVPNCRLADVCAFTRMTALRGARKHI